MGKDILWNVLVPPNIVDEESTKSAINIRENSNATLMCKADGFPKPNVTWRREDSKPIKIIKKAKPGNY